MHGNPCIRSGSMEIRSKLMSQAGRSSGLRSTESSPAPKPRPTHAHRCRLMTVDGWVRAMRTIAATSRGV